MGERVGDPNGPLVFELGLSDDCYDSTAYE